MNKKNNLSHTQKKHSKKRVLSLALGVFSAAAIAGSATALLVKLDDKPGPQPVQGYQLNFDKGTGTKITGQTRIKFKDSIRLNDISVPFVEKEYTSPTGEKNTYPFAGWRISGTEELVSSDQKLTHSYNLSAVYSDELEKKGLTYYTVNFRPSDADISKVWLTGITQMAVVEGRTLAMINKPEPHTKDTSKIHFKGWAMYGTTDVLPLDTPITSNMTLVPVYVESATVQFEANGGTLTGQTTVTVQALTEFGLINAPTATKSDVNAQYVFEGWYKEAECENKWLANEKVQSGDTSIAYARYIKTEEAESYCTANFKQNTAEGQPTVTFSGNTTVLALKTSTWKDCVRPAATAYGYRINGWQYSIDDENWLDLKDDTTPFVGQTAVSIRPVMARNVENVTILGAQTVVKGESKVYTAITIPTYEEASSVSFKLYSDSACVTELPSTVAEIVSSTTNSCNVKIQSTQTTTKQFWIKAVSQVDTSKSSTLKVAIQDGTTLDADYTILARLEGESVDTWYSIENIDNPNEAIVATPLGETNLNGNVVIPRDKFDYDVYVNERITKLPDGFLANCTSFNSKVKLTNKTVNIGENFLGKCTGFTGTDDAGDALLDMQNIQNIDNFFLNGCTTFNHALSLSVKTIGSDFLRDCSTFNASLNLGENITKLGSTDIYGQFTSHFLEGCLLFNKDIIFPASLEAIGDFVMYRCNAFTSDVIFKCSSSALQKNVKSFATDDPSADIYTQGFQIVHPTATEKAKLLAMFPEESYEPSPTRGAGYRRTYACGKLESFQTMTWEELGRRTKMYYDGYCSEDEFVKSFTLSDGTQATALSDFIGETKEVTLTLAEDDVVTHTVRVIDVNQNYCNQALDINLFTFQFDNVITTSHGGTNKPLCARFEDTNEGGTTHTKYEEMDIYNALNSDDGEKEGVTWADTIKSTTATLDYHKSIWQMLPSELQDSIRTSWTWAPRNPNGKWHSSKIFMPTMTEMGHVFTDSAVANGLKNVSSLIKAKDTGYATGNYEWYSTSGQARRKKSIVGSTTGVECYWTRSQNVSTTGDLRSCCVNASGGVYDWGNWGEKWYYYMAICPLFCL